MALQKELAQAKQIISGQNIELDRYNQIGQDEGNQAVQVNPHQYQHSHTYPSLYGMPPVEVVSLQFGTDFASTTQDAQIGLTQYVPVEEEDGPSTQTGVQHPTSAS